MPALTSLILTAILVTLFFTIRKIIHLKVATNGKPGPALMSFLIIKLTGVALFGVIPFLFLAYNGHASEGTELLKGNHSGYWYLFLLISIPVIVLNIVLSRNKQPVGNYPDIDITLWTPWRVAILLSGWLLYLAAYEYLFRGVLFFSCYSAYGFTTAVAINIAAYSLAHIPKGVREMAGAVPFGLLLSWLAWLTGSIWLPFVVHASLAVTTQIISITVRPEMSLSWLHKR